MGQCKYYYEDWHSNRCFGTKDGEYCHCDGEESKCDFYPEKRKENNNTMKYDIKIGDYVETIDGIMGYVSRVEESHFHWIVTNRIFQMQLRLILNLGDILMKLKLLIRELDCTNSLRKRELSH